MNDTVNLIRKALFELAPFAVWVPILVGLWGIKKASVPIRVLITHLLLAAIVQAVAYYLWKNSKNNLFLLHIYTVEEFVMLTIFYCLLLKGHINRFIFIGVIPVFVACAILNALYLQPVTGHNTYVRSLESLFIIIWCILFFYMNLKDEASQQYSQNNGLLIINSAFLIYFSVSLLLFTLSNFISAKSSRDLRVTLWAVHALFSILMYLLIAIGLWKNRKITT